MSLVNDSAESDSLAFLLGGSHAGTSWYRPYIAALVTVDLVAIIVAELVAWMSHLGTFVSLNGRATGEPLVPLTLLISSAWVAMLAMNGAYKRHWLGLGTEEYRRVLDTGWRSLALLALATFLVDIRLSRGFVLVTVAIATVTSVFLRYVLRQRLHAARGRGKFMKRVLVVGSEAGSREVIERLLASPHAGFRPLGACCPGTTEELEVVGAPIPVLGTPDRALHVAITIQADAIAVVDIVTLKQMDLPRLAQRVLGTGIELLVSREVTEVAGPEALLQPVSDFPLVRVEEPRFNGSRRIVKNAADRVLALVAIVALAPLLLLIGLIVRLTSRGPIIFRQTRVGLGGRHFKVWKFRTMTQCAETDLFSILHLNEHDGLLFKMKHDPRVTRIGRLLRRWSLDELPQLWNVLRGDMSLVGPRPPIPSEVARYDDRIRHRLLVKPGITGLWQVSGRAALPWDESVRLDLSYVENWSLSMDAVILGRTILAVLRRQGAY